MFIVLRVSIVSVSPDYYSQNLEILGNKRQNKNKIVIFYPEMYNAQNIISSKLDNMACDLNKNTEYKQQLSAYHERLYFPHCF